jgi:hypothetical protein
MVEKKSVSSLGFGHNLLYVVDNFQKLFSEFNGGKIARREHAKQNIILISSL